MKMKVKEFSKSKIEQSLRRICGRPSPTKRLVIVLLVCVKLAAINIYFLFSSVYSIGKNDAQKDLLQIEHIEGLKIPRNDSINLLKQKLYEFEYSE